jgi:cephalosporin-C deacetylase-like acetyl esterase
MKVKKQAAFILPFLFLFLQITLRPLNSFVPSDAQIDQFYDYDASQPLNATSELVYQDYFWKQYDIHFDSVNQERIPAYLWVPKQIWPPVNHYPVILFLHGYGGSRDMDAWLSDFLWIIELFRGQKYALILLDAQYHGDRRVPGRDIFSQNFVQDRNAFAQTIVDYRRAVDYLETRSDIESQNIFVMGISMGGIQGAMVASVEPRVQGASLIVAGGDWEELIANSDLPPADPIREALNGHYEVVPRFFDIMDPIYQVHMISPRPLQMHNGLYDTTVPTGQELYDAALEPKEIFWYPASHYTIVLYTWDILNRSLDLFDSNLTGPHQGVGPGD